MSPQVQTGTKCVCTNTHTLCSFSMCHYVILHLRPVVCKSHCENNLYQAYDKSFTAFVHSQQVPNPSCYSSFQFKCHLNERFSVFLQGCGFYSDASWTLDKFSLVNIAASSLHKESMLKIRQAILQHDCCTCWTIDAGFVNLWTFTF